jgi:hypothetical protein
MARCGCSNAASSVGVADTPTLDLSLLASVISGNVKVDALPGNLLKAVAGGLRVACTDVAACVGTAADVGVQDGPGVDLSTSGAGTPGDPRIISADTKAVFYQTSAITFSRTLSSGNDVIETVTELPALVLATAGLYMVTMDVQGTITNMGVASGTVSSSMSAYLMRDGVLVPNTETRLSNLIQGTASTAEPALGVGVTGSSTRAVFSDGTTQLRVAASRNLAGTSSAAVNSNSTGRTRITAWRIGA